MRLLVGLLFLILTNSAIAFEASVSHFDEDSGHLILLAQKPALRLEVNLVGVAKDYFKSLTKSTVEIEIECKETFVGGPTFLGLEITFEFYNILEKAYFSASAKSLLSKITFFDSSGFWLAHGPSTAKDEGDSVGDRISGHGTTGEMCLFLETSLLDSEQQKFFAKFQKGTVFKPQIFLDEISQTWRIKVEEKELGLSCLTISEPPDKSRCSFP